MCVPLVEKMADEGDSLARYVISEYDTARLAMQSENVAASAYLAEAGRG
jgi:hypothetical protein